MAKPIHVAISQRLAWVAPPSVLVYLVATLRWIVAWLVGVAGKVAEVSLRRIVLVALVLRLIWIALCPNEPTSDQFIYQASAMSIANGDGYLDESGNPANYWPVGYSGLLAPAYRLLGPAPSSAFAINLLLGLLTVVGVYLLARELYGIRAARMAGVLAAVYPTLVFYTTCVASENAYVPGMLWVVLLGTKLAREPTRWWPYAVATGVACGAVAYVRATVILLVPLVLLLVWWERRAFRTVVPRALVVVALMAATLLPWSIRAQRHFGTPTPFSLNSGANLWMGNHEGTDGGYSPLPEEVLSLPVLERDRELGRRAKAFILADPVRYVLLCAARLVRTLASDTSAVVWNEVGLSKRLGSHWGAPLKLLSTLGHYLLLGLAIGRIVVLIRAKRWAKPDTLVVAALILLSVPFVFIVSGNRYHLPLVPFLLAWAGATIAVLAETGVEATAGAGPGATRPH